jgi:hypothetical protein
MKKNKIVETKLSLKKQVLTKLNNFQMSELRGGGQKSINTEFTKCAGGCR